MGWRWLSGMGYCSAHGTVLLHRRIVTVASLGALNAGRVPSHLTTESTPIHVQHPQGKDSTFYQVGQKVRSGFSVRCYRKP